MCISQQRKPVCHPRRRQLDPPAGLPRIGHTSTLLKPALMSRAVCTEQAKKDCYRLITTRTHGHGPAKGRRQWRKAAWLATLPCNLPSILCPNAPACPLAELLRLHALTTRHAVRLARQAGPGGLRVASGGPRRATAAVCMVPYSYLSGSGVLGARSQLDRRAWKDQHSGGHISGPSPAPRSDPLCCAPLSTSPHTY